MYDEISDNHLKVSFQKFLRRQSEGKRRLLKNLLFCGSQLHADNNKKSKSDPVVFVMSNSETARFHGLATCHSSWSCPYCTAKTMAKYGQRIAVAIDALAAKYNQLAVMITFTLPHTKNMTCAETFEILQQTWRMFSKGGNRRAQCTSKYTRKNGTTVTYKKGRNPYGDFRETLGIKHNVRIYEFTWGENSWHPHIHALFWVPKENFNRVTDFENDLFERWWHCAQHCAKKVYTRYHPETANQRVENLFADWRKYPKTGHRSLWISKNEDGTPRISKSSYYISGWTGDVELTNINNKNGRNGHYTPHQILQKAVENPDEADKWYNLYMEYAMTTIGNIRVQFSARSGLKQIIDEWKQTQTYQLRVKKKCMEKAAEKWRVVCWFTKKQWQAILCSENDNDSLLTTKILQMARAPDGKEKITQLLLEKRIDIRANKFHPSQPSLEAAYNADFAVAS